MTMVRPGLFFVFSAPSGAGKTSITRALLDKDSGLYTSVSATTRTPRAGEIHGQHYYFLDSEAFSRAIQDCAFVEHAQVFHHHYGTLKDPLEQGSSTGKDALLALDPQGARSMRHLYPSRTILIYILPPKLDDLKQRLYLRDQESPEKIEHRLSCASAEIQHCVDYDYVITNDCLETAIDEAWSIIKSERCRVCHHPCTDEFLQRFSEI